MSILSINYLFFFYSSWEYWSLMLILMALSAKRELLSLIRMPCRWSLLSVVLYQSIEIGSLHYWLMTEQMFLSDWQIHCFIVWISNRIHSKNGSICDICDNGHDEIVQTESSYSIIVIHINRIEMMSFWCIIVDILFISLIIFFISYFPFNYFFSHCERNNRNGLILIMVLTVNDKSSEPRKK